MARKYTVLALSLLFVAGKASSMSWQPVVTLNTDIFGFRLALSHSQKYLLIYGSNDDSKGTFYKGFDLTNASEIFKSGDESNFDFLKDFVSVKPCDLKKLSQILGNVDFGSYRYNPFSDFEIKGDLAHTGALMFDLKDANLNKSKFISPNGRLRFQVLGKMPNNDYYEDRYVIQIHDQLTGIKVGRPIAAVRSAFWHPVHDQVLFVFDGHCYFEIDPIKGQFSKGHNLYFKLSHAQTGMNPNKLAPGEILIENDFKNCRYVVYRNTLKQINLDDQIMKQSDAEVVYLSSDTNWVADDGSDQKR